MENFRRRVSKQASPVQLNAWLMTRGKGEQECSEAKRLGYTVKGKRLNTVQAGVARKLRAEKFSQGGDKRNIHGKGHYAGSQKQKLCTRLPGRYLPRCNRLTAFYMLAAQQPVYGYRVTR